MGAAPNHPIHPLQDRAAHADIATTETFYTPTTQANSDNLRRALIG